jgi:hypothetical protein
MNLPKWYITALRNKTWYESEEYQMLLDDAVQEYNKALKANNSEKVEQWKNLILKWLHNKETNKFMLMQVKL